MTREEIISGLQMTMDLFLFDPATGETTVPDMLNDLDRTTYDACKGAIEALKALETHEKCTKTHACDCISHQATIDIEGLDEQIRCEMCRNPMHTNRGCDGNCKYDEKLYEKIMQILNERIKPLPSAQPAAQWIPCSERLPAEGTEVFVYLFDRPSAYVAWVRDGYWYTEDFEIGKEDAPSAWMPLPEPWNGEQP